MSVKTWIPLGLAVVLGLAAAWMARDGMGKTAPAAAKSDKPASLVVADRPVAPGEALKPEDLTTQPLAGTTAPDGSFTNPNQLVGRIAVVPMTKGQPITQTLLAPLGTAAGLGALVPPRMRAITVEVNEFTGVAGLITPGAHVDVIAAVHDEHGNGAVSRTIVQNVKVTAVGRQLSSLPHPDADKDKNASQTPGRSVTLLVTPHQAELIQLASVSSRPWLVLRGHGDWNTAPVDLQGVSMDDLRGPSAQSVAAAPTPVVIPTVSIPASSTRPVAALSHRTVQIIRAGAVSSAVFETQPALQPVRLTDGGE